MKSRKKPLARLPRRARLSQLQHLELSRSLNFEQLEDRRLLSITYNLADVLQAYNTGVGAVGNAATAAAVVDQVLGTGTLPLASQTLDQGLGIAADFLKPFQTTLNQSASDWNTTAQQLQTAGFTVPVPFTGNADANSNLLEVNWTQTLTPSDPIQIVGKTGFSYLDGGGGLYGGITGAGSVTVSLTFGVDVNPTTQSLNFFIAPGNAIQANVSGSTATNGLGGTIDIGDLSSVNVTATASINFTGTLGLNATASETDGKLRANDLTNNFLKVVTGGVNGSANVNAAFSAQLFGLPNVNWTGTLSDAVTNNAFQSPAVRLQEPSASSLLGSLGSSLFSLGQDVPILGPLSNTLNQPLPLIGKSIGQLTGLDNHRPSLPSLPSGFTSLDGSYPLAGGTLSVNVTPTTIDEFLRGQQVSLVSWQASGDVTLADDNLTIPIFSLGIPDIASLDIDATFGIHASLHYDIGFGLDGHGFYALAGTPTDPTLGLSFGVTAGLQGQVEVFGIPLAQAGGDLGFSVTPYVTLVAPPASVDPATDPSKVYFSDLALFGKDPASDLLDDTGAGIAGDFTGDIYAKINLLFFSLGFNWGVSIPVFNYERSPTWPGPTDSGPGATAWPNVTQSGGVLTFNGTSADDNVTLTQGSNGSLTVAWAGQGSETFNNVTSFVFNGGTGNDTLTAASGLDTPVRAVGGTGNDDFNLSNNTANNTLIAGTGLNTLVGGSGTDLLIGGTGTDVITAGKGTSIICGGSGDATITLGSGKDSFYGGAGNYNIQGGSGTYTIDGGSGSDVINAGSGLNDIIYGGSAGENQITGSSVGYTTIYGGGSGDHLIGLGGHDTLYGSAGQEAGVATNNVITGGPLGGNLIFGGGGGDVLAGGGGNNTLYAGTGNETLAGGDGLDLVANPSGNGPIDSAGDAKSSGSNLLIAGPGNDTMFGDSTGHNTLQGGPGDDTLYAGSGGDALIAGPGADALYGSVGNDTFQLPFTPVGQTQPNDTLVGGGGSDTLMVKGESGTGTPGLDVMADAINDATTTSVTVSNGSPIAADLAANGSSGLVIQIGNEQMLVTAVSGNVLTVDRGYDNTTAAPHGNNALVVLPNTVSALPAASDYELYLNQGATADSYTATLSTLRFASASAGSTTVTGIDITTGLAVGDTVTGPGIAAGTTIATIASDTSITLSTPATLSQDDLPLTFGVVGTLSFTLPGDIANIQLEGGPGNNLLQVDPSVTRDVTLYGGPGYNVLMSGSGNDALIAGPGTAVLYGGTGQDTFYAGDLPSQDVARAAGSDPALTISNNTNPVEGKDTVIAGAGNDELFAGSGNDLLIGGSVARIDDPITGTPGVALLQNGQYQLVEGAGRDILVGGTGNDVLIAGPGGPGAILEGGTGNNTLIAQNYGINTFSGGEGAGHTLILGGNLENTEISNSAAGGGNTLVGGLGINNITAGSGNDVLYASYNAAAWSQGEAAAAAVGVHVVPPQFFQGDANSQQLQTLLEQEQSGPPLSASQQVVLGDLFLDELDTLQTEEDNLTSQVKNYLTLLNQSSDANQSLKALLNAVDQQDQLVLTELSTLIGNIQDFIGGSPFQPDLLTGGLGNDTFYGNVGGATQMVGGSGHNIFYNYNANDTIQGGSGGDNALVLQGDGSMSLSQDPNNVNAVDFTINSGPALVVGDTGNVSNIQTLEIETGSENDTVTVSFATLPPGSPAPGLSGLEVLLGSGNDLVDASAFTGNETLVAGSGSDVVTVGPVIGGKSQFIGTPTSKLEVRDTTDEPVTLSKNLQTSPGVPAVKIGSSVIPLGQFSTFGKLVVVGGSGSDSFSTDGSVPNVLLEGGSGTNNSFTVNGPGNFDIVGGPATNTLTFNSSDSASGDSITAAEADYQSGATVTIAGTVNGIPLNLTATNIDPSTASVYINSGSGNNDTIDASAMKMGVTLNSLGGGGSGDILKGGSGNDTLYYSGPGGTYDGAGGTDNVLDYAANAGDVVAFQSVPQSIYPANNGFEVPNLPSNYGGYANFFHAFVNSPTNAGWTFVESGVAANQSALDVVGADNGNNDGTKSANGQAAFIQNRGYFYQTFSPGLPAGTLSVTFKIEARSSTWPPSNNNPESAPVEVTLNGVDLGTYATTNALSFVTRTTPAVPIQSGAPITLDFIDTAPYPPEGDVLIDSVSLNYIPYGELFVNGKQKSIGSLTNVENFFASGAPASLNGGTQFLLPVDDVPSTQVTPLSNVAIAGVNATPSSPAITLTGGFTDFYPDATADTATINWGDGSSSAATITGSGGNFSVSASHIYASNGAWPVVLTVIDPDGSAASADNSFTGGLTLDASGNLNAYSSATAFAQVATGVASYTVREADESVFVLNAAGALSSISDSGTGTQFPGTYPSIAVGPDNYLYALQSNGDLESLSLGSTSLQFFASGVQAIVADTTGDLYALYAAGALSVMPAGSTTWAPLLTNVKSVTPSGSGVDVLTNAGVEWQYVGTAATLVAGPRLSLTTPSTATAGQPLSAKLSVLDTNGNPVVGYTGTVTISDSDGATGDGPPLTHTFSAADNGSLPFSLTFLTSGAQTVTVTSSDGLTASARVTVNAGAATQFSVDPPPVPVGTPIPITAASWAAGVVTVTTPPIAGGFSVGDTMTISGMTPPGYNGTVTVASVQNGTQSSQFTYLLTTDPGTATALGSVTPQATITVTAYDAYGNVDTGYTGSVTLAPVDTSAGSQMISAADKGVAQFTETFNKPGGEKLVATGGSLVGNGAIVVTPASYDLSQSAVSVSPEGVAAGGQVTVTLTARDALGNAETSGGLTVAFSLAPGSVGGGPFTHTTDNGDGTYTAIFPAGPYAGLDNITATIDGVPVTSSPAPLVVTPAITSTNIATFVVGTDGSFTLTQTGAATPVYSESGKLPDGVTFDTSTGALSGTPAAGSGGVYNLLLGAAGGTGPAGTQNFTLIVNQPPTITSADSTTFTAYTTGNFSVTTASGTYPNPTFSETGALPPGVTLSQSGLLSGIPAAGSDGDWSITIDARNGVSPDTTQPFTLVVDQPPSITSAAATAFGVGAAGTFNVTTTGFPTPTFDVQGTLPAGVTLTDNHDGTATLSTTAATPAGVYSFTFDAGNGVSPDATQSFTLTVAQASPIINWSKPADITYGTALGAAQLDATATIAGNTVPGTFSYTLANGTSVASGYVLQAGQNQVLNVTFTPTDSTDYATETRQVEINVDPAPLTITAGDTSKIYGAALPTLTASYSGFVNGDTAASLTTAPTLATTATAGSHVSGSPYAITASGAVDSDYSISYVAGTLRVTPATLTITADDKNKVYGSALPTLTASYSGFVNGDTAASLTTAPTVSTTATAASHMSGSPYSITASGAVDADYTITYVPGKMTVTPAPLTITTDDKSKVYGAALPTLTASYSGFVNGDTAASLTTAPTLSTTATAASHVSDSPYPITASGAADSDYTISYVSGSLTVTPATLTVKANDASRTYGTANPTFTDSIAGFVNGDGDSVLSGAASLTTTATTNSPTGSYPITAAQGTLSAADYVIVFLNGTLTVTINAQGTFGVGEDIYVIGSGTVSVSAANGVLANDTGPGQLAVTTGTVTGAEGGTFVFNADGSFTYTPPANFPGFDYAKYAAQDSVGDQGTATINVLSQTAGVVWKFYESVLHRDPDYGGLQFWINDFSNGGKTGDIAVGFFESTELLNQIIGGYYQQYLGRGAESGGLNYWEGVWHQTGGPEGIKAGFASSPEFNALANREYASYASPWLETLYHRILNRAPDPSGLSYWQQQLASGTSEYQIALEFFNSQEAFDNDVTGWFSEYLDRAPTPAEQAFYAGQMEQGATDRNTEQEITNLPEYGANPPASSPGTGVRLPDYLPQTAAKNQTAIAATDAVFASIGGD